MRKRKVGPHDALERILDKAEDMPVLPHIAMEILNLIDDKYSVPDDFENVVENDQVLTLKILKLANSAYYGYPREIISIKEAIIILGLDTLKSLALSMLTRRILSKNLNNYGLSRGQLWEHSLAVGMIARSLARSLKLANLERFFVSGLLHDIGKLLFDLYLDHYGKDFHRQILEGGLQFSEAEARISGHDHAWLGSKLIERWNLPDFLVQTVRYHHLWDKAPSQYQKDAYIINIANRLSYSIARGSGTEFPNDKSVSAEEYGKLGMTGGDVEDLLQSIKKSLQVVKI